jgi:hypothetical protein
MGVIITPPLMAGLIKTSFEWALALSYKLQMIKTLFDIFSNEKNSKIYF